MSLQNAARYNPTENGNPKESSRCDQLTETLDGRAFRPHQAWKQDLFDLGVVHPTSLNDTMCGRIASARTGLFDGQPALDDRAKTDKLPYRRHDEGAQGGVDYCARQ